MTRETITRIKLTASAGYVLTNNIAYGTEVYLGVDDAPENWYEIAESEYEEILKSQNPDTLIDVVEDQHQEEMLQD